MASGSARNTSASRPSAASQRKPSAAVSGGNVQQQQRTEFSQGAHLIAAAAPQDAGEALGRWEAAVGNLEDARVALDVVAKAIDDAGMHLKGWIDDAGCCEVAICCEVTCVSLTQCIWTRTPSDRLRPWRSMRGSFRYAACRSLRLAHMH